MSDLKGYSIKHIGEDAYVLVDSQGNVVPHQLETSLKSSAHKPPTFTVVFQAGRAGLRVDDKGDDSDV